jgi:glucosamine--fructose-6-phosphate aminotransferase (isomerizing)
MGASMFACVALEYKLCSLGIRASLIEAGELLHYQHEACNDSVTIVVSRSGESVEVEKLLKLLKSRVPIIGVSNNPGSLLATTSDISIHICSRPDEMIAIQTYTGTVLTLHLLSAAVDRSLSAELSHIDSVLNELAGLIEHELKDIVSWDELLNLNSPVYLLGRGPSYGSVLEGTLLFHETAKAPAVGMYAASFRHGPVEMVDSRFAGIVFAPAGRTRELNVGLARDLIRFGGKVRVIGPRGPDVDGIGLRRIPEISESLAPLFEVVPLQCAALRLAKLRGLEIGAFRYTPQVTRSELTL